MLSSWNYVTLCVRVTSGRERKNPQQREASVSPEEGTETQGGGRGTKLLGKNGIDFFLIVKTTNSRRLTYGLECRQRSKGQPGEVPWCVCQLCVRPEYDKLHMNEGGHLGLLKESDFR